MTRPWQSLALVPVLVVSTFGATSSATGAGGDHRATSTSFGQISGTVTDERGRPLEGIHVDVDRQDDDQESWFTIGTVVTDAEGHYSLVAGNNGSRDHLVFRDPTGDHAWEVWEDAVARADGTDLEPFAPPRVVDVSLAPGATITGTVRVPLGARPTVGVGLWAELADGSRLEFLRQTAVDDLGRYEVRGLAAGRYRMAFTNVVPTSDRAFSAQFWNREASLARSTPLVVDSPSGGVGDTVRADAVMEPTTHLRGTVRGSDGRGVAAGVTLFQQIGDRWTTLAVTVASTDGSYDFDRLDSGVYRVEFDDGDGPDAVQFNGGALTFDTAPEVVVEVGADRDGVDARLVRASTISGVVTVRGGGSAAGSVVVDRLVDGRWREAEAITRFGPGSPEPSGTYEVGDLPEGTYRVRFEPTAELIAEAWDDRRPGQRPTDVRVGPATDVSGIDAELERAGQAELPVTNDLGSVPADVYAFAYRLVDGRWEPLAEGWSAAATTSLTRLPPGTYVVELVDRDGFFASQWYRGATSMSGATRFVVRPGETTSLQPVTLEVDGIANVRAPRVVGRAGRQEVLRVDTGRWAPSTVDLRLRWLRDGSPIARATGERYRPTLADVGHLLSVRVVASRPGYQSAATEVTAAQRIERIVLAPLRRPTLRGTPVVGRTLAVGGDTYVPAAGQRRWQWYADGRALRGQTSDRLVLSPATAGRRVAVRILASRTGTTTVSTVVAAPGRVRPRS